MAAIERKFVPITEVEGETIEIQRRKKTSQVIVDFGDLPTFKDKDRKDILRSGIGINISALGRRAKISNIDSVTIRTQPGEISSTSQIPVAINPDGSGISGLRRKNNRIATGTVASDGNRLDLTINTSEIQRRLKERDIPLRSQAGWAAEMNRALELGFMKYQLDRMKEKEHLLIEGVALTVPFLPPHFGYIADGLKYFATMLIATTQTPDEVQSFPLFRTITGIGVSGKDFILGTQSIVRVF